LKHQLIYKQLKFLSFTQEPPNLSSLGDTPYLFLTSCLTLTVYGMPEGCERRGPGGASLIWTGAPMTGLSGMVPAEVTTGFTGGRQSATDEVSPKSQMEGPVLLWLWTQLDSHAEVRLLLLCLVQMSQVVLKSEAKQFRLFFLLLQQLDPQNVLSQLQFLLPLDQQVDSEFVQAQFWVLLLQKQW
jgi:hypothetical protein